MKQKRRTMLKAAALTSLGVITGGSLNALDNSSKSLIAFMPLIQTPPAESIIGLYGHWATTFHNNQLPRLSFRNEKYKPASLQEWHHQAYNKLMELLAMPELIAPSVKVNKQYIYDGLHIEELSWKLPYGRSTAAILLKPAGITGKLPAILAFHDHGGNKYLGTRKITKTSDNLHPVVKEHQQEYYEGAAWANEIAKRGYVVLVADAFPFASRRVMLQDVPERIREGLTDNDPEKTENIEAYNKWAGKHEHIIAKSLFSAGLTWPGVFLAEDKVALDILSARPDVDASAIGCCGLSGGGMRTVFMGGTDPRIKCAVCVGFMTTWRDFVLNKSYTHTWMTYVPLLPQYLDFPEIFGLRAPLPTMVLNDSEDSLYTLPEMKEADTILSNVFKKAGAADRYKCSFYPGPHKFDLAMQNEAFNWFDKWLKK